MGGLITDVVFEAYLTIWIQYELVIVGVASEKPKVIRDGGLYGPYNYIFNVCSEGVKFSGIRVF